jgi:hypothetical protein
MITKELAFIAGRGFGQLIPTFSDERLGRGVWEFKEADALIRLLENGVQWTDRQDNRVLEVLYSEIIEIESYLTGPRISDAMKASANDFIPMKFVLEQGVSEVHIPIIVYSAILIEMNSRIKRLGRVVPVRQC